MMMVARRNWLLRFSILINIAVLLYICSNMMIGDSNMNIGTGYQVGIKLAQQSLQSMIPETPPVAAESTKYISSSSSSSSNGGGGGTGSSDKINAQQQDEQLSSNVQHIEPKYKLVSDVIQDDIELEPNNKEIKDVNNLEETRFEVPTDASYPPAAYQDINLVNQSINNEGGGEILGELESRLKSLIKCHDRSFEPVTEQRGDFWVLRNYIRAEHGELRCLESITYTTHSDYTFLDNIIPLLERWNSPVSVAMHAPGTDFIPTINSIKYLRDCLPESNLVRQFATFHVYFSSKHIPKTVPKYNKVLDTPYNCSIPPPYANITSGQLYKTQKKLLYPVNVGRNIARDAAMTHFILASDIELYPNPGLVKKFLEMQARNDAPLQRKAPRVFPLSLFEVDSKSPVPRDKTELQELLRTQKAIPFHKRVCSSCHGVPRSKEWMAANETEDLGIFHIGKRTGYFVHWEPIYIGTHNDPHYDERLSWEGKSDKMTQGFALCVLDYEFHILDHAFLVHKPGIKILKKDPKRAMLAGKTNQLIKKIIYPELQVMYGTRKGCAV